MPSPIHSCIHETHPLSGRTYFFDQGIHFECQQCGQCCVGDPGIVRVRNQEMPAIAKFLNISKADFETNYLYPYQNHYAIREHEDGRCVFYENGCRIYPVRPIQCRAFPFWAKVFRSEENFNQMKKQCPGIGKGRFFSKTEILDLMLVF